MTSADDELIMIYTTLPSFEAAQEIGGELVAQKLAGCVNIIPGMTAIFEWQGDIQEANECVLLIKTRKSLQEKTLIEAAKIHPYDVPALLALEPIGGNQAYRDWIFAQTQPEKQSS